MEDFHEEIDTIINEVKNPEGKIKILETYCHDLDHTYSTPDPENKMKTLKVSPLIYDFSLTFNEVFTIESMEYQINDKPFIDYSKHLNKINDEVSNKISMLVTSDEISVFDKKEKLQTESIMLDHLLSDYYRDNMGYLIHKGYHQEKEFDKSINYPILYSILEHLFMLQKNTIEKLQVFIKAKQDLLENTQFPTDDEVFDLWDESDRERGFQKIRFMDDTKVLTTLFFDLLKQRYIKTNPTNLERFILASFNDKDGEALKQPTIKSYLKPGNVKNKALEDKRIKIPPRKY